LLSIEQLESLDALERIGPEWRALWERDTGATPFESPEWLLPWTRHMWSGGRLRVLAVRSGGSLVGLAPFFHWGYGRKPEVIRVSLLGSGMSGHLGMIAAPEFTAPAARLVLDYLAAATDEWHLCDLRELRAGSPLLRAEIPPGLSGRDAPGGGCAALRLPRTMDGLPAAAGADLRAARNRLGRKGRIEFVRANRPAEVAPLMRELFALDERRLPESRVRRFHLETAQRFAALGMLRLHALQCGGRTAAVRYGLRRGERCFDCLSALDPSRARSGADALLLAETVRQAIEEGAREIDFLCGPEGLHYRWGARGRVNRRLLIARSAAAYARAVA
jgi:CelD/BcsL family acetyltransferase involved in cellulose biosynthesis